MNDDVPAYEPFPSFQDFADRAAYAPAAFDAFAANFTKLKELADDAILQRSVETATRWAAINTGAIEGLYDVDRGFTYTVAASAAAFDEAHLLKGQDVQDKIADQLAGYEIVLDVTTGARPVTEKWIKEIHATICASQETFPVYTAAGWQEHELPKGEYKTDPNNPMQIATGQPHSYASPTDTPPEMGRLVQELTSEEFQRAHPVLQAAYAHYAFVCIHPFADGNGRVSRALASTFMYANPGVPLVIFADQKGNYIQALESADEGLFGTFAEFISNCALDIIAMVSQDMRRPERPAVAERLSALNSALISQAGLPHSEVDAVAVRLRDLWEIALAESLTEVSASGFGDPVAVRAESAASGYLPPPDGFRQPQMALVRLAGNVQGPAPSTRTHDYIVRVPVAGSSTVDFVLFRLAAQPLADVALRELYPIATTALQYRLKVLAEDEVRDFVHQLVSTIEEQLRERGFNPPAE